MYTILYMTKKGVGVSATISDVKKVATRLRYLAGHGIRARVENANGEVVGRSDYYGHEREGCKNGFSWYLELP